MNLSKKPLLIIAGIVIAVALFSAFNAFGSSHTCSWCREDFRGHAYRDLNATAVFCRPCARDYWFPFELTPNMRIR